MPGSNKLSDTEWRVMHTLWEGSPKTAREVLSSVEAETGWAYTTVKTILSRLADKGVVSATLEGNTTSYSAAISRDSARKSALRGLLDRAFDGTFGSLIHHLAADERLSQKDRDALAALLAADGTREEGSLDQSFDGADGVALSRLSTQEAAEDDAEEQA